MSTESMMLFNHLIISHPLLLLPSIFPSIWVFSNESALCIRWPKYWSFSFSISPSNDSSGLISFRTDWFDLLVIQRTLKSLLQYHSSKASILWHSAFFVVQLSNLYMTTGKTIQTFVGKVMSLLFNMLSRFVIYFLPRNKHLLISRLQLQSTSDFGVQEKKMCHCFQFFNSYLPLNNGTGCCYLSFFNVEINQHFHSLLSSLSRALLVPFLFLPLNWYNLHIWGY